MNNNSEGDDFFFDDVFFFANFLVLLNAFLVLVNVVSTFLVLVNAFLVRNRGFFILGLLQSDSNAPLISEIKSILLCNS